MDAPSAGCYVASVHLQNERLEFAAGLQDLAVLAALANWSVPVTLRGGTEPD